MLRPTHIQLAGYTLRVSYSQCTQSHWEWELPWDLELVQGLGSTGLHCTPGNWFPDPGERSTVFHPNMHQGWYSTSLWNNLPGFRSYAPNICTDLDSGLVQGLCQHISVQHYDPPSSAV